MTQSETAARRTGRSKNSTTRRGARDGADDAAHTRRQWLAGAGAALAAAAASPLLGAPGDASSTPPVTSEHGTGSGGAAGAAGAGGPSPAHAPATRPAGEPFGYCLNTSTISGQNLGIVQELQIAAGAGFHGVEPWIRDLDAYVKGGGSLADLRKQIADLGLVIPSSIGFAPWIFNDEAQRAKGMEQMKRDMDTVAQIGGARIAAPPVGAQNAKDPDVPLEKAAERYRALCELGDQTGVVPQVEVWGFSKTIKRLGEGALIAIDSNHPKACVLADVYHLYKGGSDPRGLRLLSNSALHVLHTNDYPADPPRETIGDAQRVFPGDGVAPLTQILRDLRNIGFTGFLSLELFNRDYWKRSPVKVAQEGIEKMRAVVRKSLG